MKTNTIILIVATLIVAAGAYWYFFTGTDTNPPLTTTSSSSSGGNLSEAQFQALLSELQPITFNTSIFSDPLFAALVNLATPINPEPIGRTDPFAPISGISSNE
jgi:hypothetical protein